MNFLGAGSASREGISASGVDVRCLAWIWLLPVLVRYTRDFLVWGRSTERLCHICSYGKKWEFVASLRSDILITVYFNITILVQCLTVIHMSY